MQREMRPFLQEGLKQYAKAKSTIATFEIQAGLLLKAAVEARQENRWLPLKDRQVGRPSPGGGSGAYGYWVSINITGKSQHHGDVEIDCGLWWNAPELHISEPIIYAEFYDKPKQATKFSWDGKGKGIDSFPHRNRTVLYLPIPKSLEVAGPLNRLLDALLNQLR